MGQTVYCPKNCLYSGDDGCLSEEKLPEDIDTFEDDNRFKLCPSYIPPDMVVEDGCFFCKEAGEEPEGEITMYLGLSMCQYHRKRAEAGFEQGMSEQTQEIQDAYREMTN